jgi:hypothetical protein
LAAPINRIGRERLHAGCSKLTSIHELRRLEWFRTLREYRDYVTHYASIDISVHEPREGVLRAYLHAALQMHEVVAPVGSHRGAAPP